jgi:hypothetical protein
MLKPFKIILWKDVPLKQILELIFGIFSTVLQFLFSPEDFGAVGMPGFVLGGVRGLEV